jgi:hypothetical protein
MDPTLRRWFAGRAVVTVLGVLVGFWMLSDLNLVPGWSYAVLYPIVLPWYLAILLASGLRNAFLPGADWPIYVVGFLFLYFEAVLIGAGYRALRGSLRDVRTKLAQM